MSTDVVLVGAGLQGCGVALRLAQAGVRVVVLERSIPGAEASSAAGGILSPGVEAEPGPFHDLCVQSLARWRDFAAEVERLSGSWVGYREGGTLEVSVDDRFTPVLAARAALLERAGLDVAVLDGEAVRRLEPGLSPGTRGGIFFPEEASVDPRLLGRALHAAAARAGARFVQGQVRGIAVEGGRVVGVDHESGRIAGRRGGARGRRLVVQVAGNELPAGAVRPVRGQIAVLDTRPPLLSRVVFSDKGYLVPSAGRADPLRLHHGGGRLREGGDGGRPPARAAGRGGGGAGAGHRAGRGDLVQLPAGHAGRAGPSWVRGASLGSSTPPATTATGCCSPR